MLMRPEPIFASVEAVDPPRPLFLLGPGGRRFDQALANFRRVRELAPDHWESRFNEAVVLAFGLRRYDEAEALVEELRRLQPDNPNVERLAAGIEESKSAACARRGIWRT